mgnify:CR=1 FL=1
MEKGRLAPSCVLLLPIVPNASDSLCTLCGCACRMMNFDVMTDAPYVPVSNYDANLTPEINIALFVYSARRFLSSLVNSGTTLNKSPTIP